MVQRSFEVNFNIGLGIHKREIKLLWSSESVEVKYNIGFEIPIEFPSQRKKIIQIGPWTRNWPFVVQ